MEPNCLIVPFPTQTQQTTITVVKSAEMTLDDFLEHVFWPDKQNLRYLTKRGYLSDIKLRISPILGHKPIGEIDYSSIQHMINISPTYKAAKTAKETLSAILGHAVYLRLIPYNPALARFIYPDKIVPKEPVQGVWLTNFSQIAYVLNTARRYDEGGEIERLCLIGYGSGPRKGEILAIDGDDIYLDTQSVYINKSWTRGEGGPEMHGLKTPWSLRELPILDYPFGRITKLVEPGTPFVIYKGKRSNPASIANRLRFFRERYGLPRITVASMRHSFATSLVRAGVPLTSIQQWLGHSSLTTTTNTYLKPSVEDLRCDAEEVSKILNRELKLNKPTFSKLTPQEKDQVKALILNDASGEDREKVQKDLELNLDLYLTPKMTPKNGDLIVEMIKKVPSITQKQMAEKLNISLSSVKRITSELKQEGKISYKGSSKKGVWQLVS